MRGFGNLVSLFCRLFLAGLFLWAAHDKAWYPQAFAWDVARYGLLPLWVVNTASVWLAWLELLLGALLLAGLLIRPAALWCLCLLAMFTGLMIYAGFTGAGFDCGCFPGQAGHPAGFEAAIRDLIFMLPALWLLRFPGVWLAVDSLLWSKDH